MDGLLSSLLPRLPLGGPRIAVLEIYGPLGPVIRGPEFVRTISALAQDQRVRSVVIACGASKVVALPTALVGSIGVVLVRPVVQELMERIGVKMVITKEGRLKDMFQPFREPTDEEQEKVQELTSE